MIKKMMLLAVSAAAVVAFAVPAAAQATVVTNAFGEAASTITAVSENTVSETASGTLDCDTVNLHLAVTQSGSTAHGVGGGTAEGREGSHEGECHIAENGVPILITSIEATVELEEGGTGSANFAYTYDITHPVFGTIPCSFTGEAVVSYPSGSNEISINGTLAGSGAGCPTSGTIEGDFVVSDEFGLPATIH